MLLLLCCESAEGKEQTIAACGHKALYTAMIFSICLIECKLEKQMKTKKASRIMPVVGSNRALRSDVASKPSELDVPDGIEQLAACKAMG